MTPLWIKLGEFLRTREVNQQLLGIMGSDSKDEIKLYIFS